MCGNRQIRILSGGKEIQENRYDGEGLRAGLTVNGKKSTFLYVNRELYTEFDETGTDISRYILGNGLAGLEYQGKLYGIHQDEQLSTGWVTGEAAVPENAYEYDAFGMILGSHENVPNRLLYGGQQYDAETEQYYLRARYYNPVIGRFMQEDTCRGDGLNLYAYCANNPVMYYDPSGGNGIPCGNNADAENESRTHSVEKRIVSIRQPWLRPIVRGKAKTPVEFGAKLDLSIDENSYSRIEHISFEAYNENGYLQEAIERYHGRTGHYPERVLVD